MLDTEMELRNVQSVVSVLKNELINIALEVHRSFSARLSEKKKNKLYEELRRAHENLQAAKEAARILVEDPIYPRTVIAESIELSKGEEIEQREKHRNRIFYDDFTPKAIDNEIPSSYLSLISLFLNELYAIRDAVDPPIGRNCLNKLREFEKESLVNTYRPAIENLCKKGLSTEAIAKKLNIDNNQIKIALAHPKGNEDEKEP